MTIFRISRLMQVGGEIRYPCSVVWASIFGLAGSDLSGDWVPEWVEIRALMRSLNGDGIDHVCGWSVPFYGPSLGDPEGCITYDALLMIPSTAEAVRFRMEHPEFEMVPWDGDLPISSQS